MKNLKSVFLLIILIFTLCITACKKEKDEDVIPHSHNYVDGICSCGDVQTVKFTVMFLDYDGNIIKKEEVEKNGAATAPANPTKEGYVFDGWNVSFNNVTQDLVVKPNFIKIEHYHQYYNGQCGCGTVVTETNGLEYKLSTDGSYYIVVGIGQENRNKQVIVVPSHHENLPVKEIGDDAFSNGRCTQVILQEGITKIGEASFDDCNYLTELHLPTTLKSVGYLAFGECMFASLTLPEGLEFLGNLAFYRCSNLQELYIPASVTMIEDNLCYQCTSLKKIEVSPANPNYVSKDYVLFTKDMTQLMIYPSSKEDTEYKMPNTVTRIESGAFGYAKSLTNITLSNNLQTLGEDVFDLCEMLQYNIYNGLKYLGSEDNPYYAVVGYTSKEIVDSLSIHPDTKMILQRALSGISHVEEFILPSGLLYIGSMSFSSCSNLKSINIPNSVKVIDDYAFYWCVKLESICLPASLQLFDPNIFSSCLNLKLITVDPNNQNFKSIDNVLYSKDGKTLYYYPSWLTQSTFTVPKHVEKIAERAFYDCCLTEIVLPDGLLEIGDMAFYNCNGLSQIILPKTLKHIGDEVFSRTSLKSIVIPSSVLTMGNYVFNGCYDITIYCELTSTPKDWQYYWCYIPGYNADGTEYPPVSYNVVWDYK